MRRYKLLPLVTLALIFLCITFISAYQVSSENTRVNSIDDFQLTRAKRQLEDLESDDYPVSSVQEAEEEPGFWDRVVKVALRLFNKFIEWLNSS